MKNYELLNFGDFLRSLRRQERLPLRKVAAMLDLDPSTLGKIEKNTRSPNLEQIVQLSKIFNVKTSDLHSRYLSDRYALELKKLKYHDKIIELTNLKLKLKKNHEKY